MIHQRWPLNLDDLARHIGRAVTEEDVERAFRRLGGTVSISPQDDALEIAWRPSTGSGEPLETAISWLASGDRDDAVIVLEVLLATDPDEPNVLYNLGMAHSDAGRLDRARTLLEQLVAAESDHVNARVALAVACQRAGDAAAARPHLEQALAADPDNPWALRNMGALLLRDGDPNAAAGHLRRATELNPRDPQSWFGLAQADEALGDSESADDAYERAIEHAGFGELAEAARQARSRIAQATFRERGGQVGRPDAVMYLLDALERFDRMSEKDIAGLTMEIALLGRQGLDVNDPDRRYQLGSLAGKFSGLQLVSIMYAGLHRVQPGTDMGFDLEAEYRQALTLFEGGRGGGSHG